MAPCKKNAAAKPESFLIPGKYVFFHFKDFRQSTWRRYCFWKAPSRSQLAKKLDPNFNQLCKMILWTYMYIFRPGKNFLSARTARCPGPQLWPRPHRDDWALGHIRNIQSFWKIPTNRGVFINLKPWFENLKISDFISSSMHSQAAATPNVPEFQVSTKPTLCPPGPS